MKTLLTTTFDSPQSSMLTNIQTQSGQIFSSCIKRYHKGLGMIMKWETFTGTWSGVKIVITFNHKKLSQLTVIVVLCVNNEINIIIKIRKRCNLKWHLPWNLSNRKHFWWEGFNLLNARWHQIRNCRHVEIFNSA